jgi:AcrR family transcriptional regulator
MRYAEQQKPRATTGRVVKAPEIRRSELVDCAQALFFTKGYESTTVADIIARAGVSKGGFYHHFLSKEELLDALIERITAAILANASDVLEDGKLDALSKLNRFFERTLQWKAEATPAWRGLVPVLFNPANTRLYHRMVQSAAAAVGPVLTDIIEQGEREGLFDVPDARLVADLLLHLGNARYAILAETVALVDQGEVEAAATMVERRLQKEEILINRLLGLAPGKVRIVEPGALRSVLEGLR